VVELNAPQSPVATALTLADIATGVMVIHDALVSPEVNVGFHVCVPVAVTVFH
jgi:hypothetical protein